MKKIMFDSMAFVAVFLFSLLTISCKENEYGTVDLSGYTSDSSDGITYSHPTTLYTADDFSRVKAALADGSAPDEVAEEFDALKSNRYTTGDYGITIHTHQQIVRGNATNTIEGTENYGDAMKDAAAAYQFSLLWQLTGETQYAEKGINILNAWATVCEAVTSNDSNHYLAAGAQGFTFAAAGEQLRDYEGWDETDFEIFKAWMVDVFASKNYDFLVNHCNVTCGATHYWSNWDLVNLCSYLQIGILVEDDDLVNYAVSYFARTGVGNGNISKLVVGDAHTDPLGTGETLYQNQESGRDQGHASMSVAVTAQLCQLAWSLYQSNPSYSNLDFFGLNDSAVLRMAEYVALTNLKDGADNANSDGSWICSVSLIPWTTVGPWCTGSSSHEASNEHTQFSETSRGEIRPGWEIIYRHYMSQGVEGYAYSEMFAGKLRPEGGSGDSRYGSNSGAFDQVGWNTLMMYDE